MPCFIKLFLGRVWPIAWMTGIGMGMAVNESSHTFWQVQKILSQKKETLKVPIAVKSSDVHADERSQS